MQKDREGSSMRSGAQNINRLITLKKLTIPLRGLKMSLRLTMSYTVNFLAEGQLVHGINRITYMTRT